jgi:putative ABC transport system permease protein
MSEGYQEFKGYTNPDENVSVPMYLQFIPDEKYLDFIKKLGLPTKEYTGQNGKMIACAKQRIDKKDGSLELFDLFASPTKTVSITPTIENKPDTNQEQNIDLTFVDTYPIDPPQLENSVQSPTVFMVVAPYSLMEKFDVPNVTTVLGLSFESKNPSLSGTEMESMLKDMGITSGYTLYNVATMLEQFRNLTFVVDVFTYVFVIMISLIAVANVFNTISTNIKLRRRELAMLRSMGMSDRDFQRMMNFECIFYGMRTLLFGVPLATLSSWLIFKGLAASEQMEHFHYAFPWKSMTISIFGVLLIVFVTMLYAISKIKRENIIDALRDDMT